MFYALGGLLLAASFVAALVILVAAFKESTAQGLLSLFIPGYILYYGFARYKSPKKGIVVGVWVGASVLGSGSLYYGMMQTAQAIQQAFNDPSALAGAAAKLAAAAPSDKANAVTAEDKPSFGINGPFKASCNTPTDSTCEDYGAGYFDIGTVDGAKELCEKGQNHRGKFTMGPCPSAGLLGSCVSPITEHVTRYYKTGGHQGIIKDPKSDCESLSSQKWVAAK